VTALCDSHVGEAHPPRCGACDSLTTEYAALNIPKDELTMLDPKLTELKERLDRLEARYGITDEPVVDDGTQWFPKIAGYTRIPGTKRYTPTETEAR
jgi:hypothetical protein